ncbi:MAG: tetratricopeptide repeat protein, partial [Ignavibacteriales bacterium]
MINYCPECGIKIEKEFKYCPNCGTELNLKQKTGDKSAESVIICKNCGEENPATNYECSSCGAALKKGKQEKKQKVEQKRVDRVSEVPGQKSLDITKLIAIFAGILGIAFVILIASGVFDDPVPEVKNTGPEQSSGVDLSAIQQINDLEKRVQADTSNYVMLLELAHLKNDHGFYERAIADYNRYLEKNPGNADARIDLGVCYYNLKQYDNAIREMKKALEYKPDHQIGHLNLGIVNLAAGNLDESRIWLEKTVAINPENEIGRRAQELLKNH